MEDISISGGSVTGTMHDASQDRYRVILYDDIAVMAVSDGCGSTNHSEFGARFFTHWVVSFLTAFKGMAETKPEQVVTTCWEEFQKTVSYQIRELSCSVEDEQRVWSSMFIATLHVLVVTPDTTFSFGSGDGVYWFNDTVTSLEPPVHNSPAYPAYFFYPDPGDERYAQCPFDLYFDRPTSELEYAGVGTDGVDEMMDKSQEEIRGGGTVGGVDQFRDEKYVENPSLVSKRLRAVGQVNGKLSDDTTLAFALRDTEESR